MSVCAIVSCVNPPPPLPALHTSPHDILTPSPRPPCPDVYTDLLLGDDMGGGRVPSDMRLHDQGGGGEDGEEEGAEEEEEEGQGPRARPTREVFEEAMDDLTPELREM